MICYRSTCSAGKANHLLSICRHFRRGDPSDSAAEPRPLWRIMEMAASFAYHSRRPGLCCWGRGEGGGNRLKKCCTKFISSADVPRALRLKKEEVCAARDAVCFCLLPPVCALVDLMNSCNQKPAGIGHHGRVSRRRTRWNGGPQSLPFINES